MEPHYPIGPHGKHIDIFINRTIPIEIKIFHSDKDVDDVIGQLRRHFEVCNLSYGIAFGVDMTIKKNQKALL